MPKLLILGGTGDAVQLADQAVAMGWEVISSLAGRTQQPRKILGEVRVGGFGGVAGLMTYLYQERIDGLIDATHPYAEQISANAAQAAASCGVPRLLLQRPGWQQVAGDRWLEVKSHGAAAALLPELLPNVGQRVFLTIGRQEVGRYAHVQNLWFLMRSIEPPTGALPPGELLLTQGPFTTKAERLLMEQYGIAVVVSKNSGGTATYGKIEAARELGLPVVIIQRPPVPAGETVSSVEAALTWLRQQMGAG